MSTLPNRPSSRSGGAGLAAGLPCPAVSPPPPGLSTALPGIVGDVQSRLQGRCLRITLRCTQPREQLTLTSAKGRNQEVIYEAIMKGLGGCHQSCHQSLSTAMCLVGRHCSAILPDTPTPSVCICKGRLLVCFLDARTQIITQNYISYNTVWTTA